MVICSPQLGLNPNSILGGEVFDREILFGIARKRIRVEIILPKGKPHDKNIKNWRITYLPLLGFPAILGNLLIVPYLFKIYQNQRFDILRIHSPKFLGLGCLFFKLIKREVKLVATYHKFEETRFGPFSKNLNNFWDHIVCDSDFVKKKISKLHCVPASKITVVHNGVPRYLKPTPKDKKLEKKLKLEGKIVLLFMGLFIERKNPLSLLDVLTELSKTRSDVVLIFWGSGPLESEIINRAKQLKVFDKIRIIDPIFGSEKNKIHNLCDIFVHPSLDEGFALAPLESMACGKPIVITNAYSAREVVNQGANGFLCNSNDMYHWNEKILKLIGDSTLRKKTGKVSLDKVKKEFQWKFAVEKHIKSFRKIIGEES